MEKEHKDCKPKELCIRRQGCKPYSFHLFRHIVTEDQRTSEQKEISFLIIKTQEKAI